MMIEAVSEGLPQNFALVGTACTLILGGFFWLLKYFFQKDAANTALRFEEFKADFNKVVDRLDAEIRGVDRRLQAVELEQVRNYVLRKDFEDAITRLNQRLDAILAAVNGTKP